MVDREQGNKGTKEQRVRIVALFYSTPLSKRLRTMSYVFESDVVPAPSNPADASFSSEIFISSHE